MSEWRDSPPAVSGLPQGNRARCPERCPRDNDGAEEECVEGLKFPPLPVQSLLEGRAFKKWCRGLCGIHTGMRLLPL